MGTMAKRLNRLLAALAATATLATGVAGSAWADTADGKVDFDVKAADGTTLDGTDVGLYKVGDWNMDALERGSDGSLTGIHAVSADADDRAGFTVGADGAQTAAAPHGRAAKAAGTAGIETDGSTDPLDAVWALGASDTRVGAFARAYAQELSGSGATPDADVKGAGSVRLDPGVYIAVAGSDVATAVLAGTATADGGVVKDRADMGSVTLTGVAVKSGETSEPNLWDKVKGAVQGLIGLDGAVSHSDGVESATDDTPTLEGKLTVAEDKTTDASKDTTRVWRIGDLGDSSNEVIKGLENGSMTEVEAVKRLDALTKTDPVGSIKGTGLVDVGAGWFLTVTNGQRHVTAVGSHTAGNSLFDGEVFVEGSRKRSRASTRALDDTKVAPAESGIATQSMDNTTVSVGKQIGVMGTNIPTNQFTWHSPTGDREAFCLQPKAYTPANGSTVRVAPTTTNQGIWRAMLFYGVGGPGDWFSRNGVNADNGRAIMHIQLAYQRGVQTGDPMSYYPGKNGVAKVDDYYNGRAWVNFVLSHPINNGIARGNDGNLYSIDTYELTALGAQNVGKQIMASSIVHRNYDLDINTQAISSNDTDSRDDDRTWISDTVAVTARNGDWPNNERLNMTVTLNYDPTPDGINPDGTAQANNASDRKSVTKSKEWSLSNGLPNGHTEYFHPDWFYPSDLFGQGKGWQCGRYWFDVKVTRGGGNIHMNRDEYTHSGYADGNEGFNRTLVTGKTAAKIKSGGSWADLAAAAPKNMLGSNAPVRDYVDLSGTYPRYKADSSNGGKRQTFTVKQTLHHRDASGRTTDSAAKTFKYAYSEKTPTFADQNSPEFTPSDLGMKDGWDAGDYWFDNVIEGHLTEDSATDPKADGYHKNTETPGETSVVKTWHSHGQTEANEHWTVAKAAAPTISTKAVASGATAGGTQPVHDSITVTNSDPNRAITIAKVTTTLHMKAGNRKASKTVGPVTIPAGGSKTFDSADFVPSDLGRKCWSRGTYWFNANVSASDATYPSGAKALTADLVHDGKNDAAQSFTIRLDEKGKDFSTQAQNTFSTAGGTSATHDRLILTTDPDSVAEDLSVKVTLNWNASATGTTATKTSTKSDVFTAGSAYKDLKDFTPGDLGMANGWLAGRYWYDVTIPAQDGVDDTIVLDGLKKDAAKESWTTKAPFGLDLAKLAYIGQPGQGRWSDEPVKGATFTLTETTGRDGATAKPGATPKTVTTDANGSAHLLDGTVLPSEVRWFKLVETKAPSAYEAPAAGSYWMIKATGTPTGATVEAFGSDAAAKALLKGVGGSTVTVGDRLEGNIMPPLTGGRYDVARAAALAGLVTLGLLAAGCAVLRRRDANPNR